MSKFSSRHIGINTKAEKMMCDVIGVDSCESLLNEAIPSAIRLERKLNLPSALEEHEARARIDELGILNAVPELCVIGQGFYRSHTPAPIQRGILENPAWYTPYTPYQAEIAQGRLESLLNFQTMVSDLVGLPIANASMLDEASSAAEAMTLLRRVNRKIKGSRFLVDIHTFDIVKEVLQTRASTLNIELVIAKPAEFDFSSGDVFGVYLQSPNAQGQIQDLRSLIEDAHRAGALVACGSDLLACVLMTPPGEDGADVVVGNAGRFGVPLGYGGPHAAFFACRDDFKRQMPGRIVGVSQDKSGRSALRLALQTREQHIRREKATSNICTAQALLANVAAMYALYHGPNGLRDIATQVANTCARLADELKAGGLEVLPNDFFDTLSIRVDKENGKEIKVRAADMGVQLFFASDTEIRVSVDETIGDLELNYLIECLRGDEVEECTSAQHQISRMRTSPILEHPNFNTYPTETELMRYMTRLQSKDLSLVHSMTPLGSCTMKLNAASEMQPLSDAFFNDVHPFAPESNVKGYIKLIGLLEQWLCEITGFNAFSFEPNSGAQGEYAGLLAIRAYLDAKGEETRRICLIPESAHGTNPASAVLAGFDVKLVRCNDNGAIDEAHLQDRLNEFDGFIAAIMITYPSTYGVFDDNIQAICDRVHQAGGQVYMDGANMNAQMGLCRPGDFGADVAHLNLHKTFCIPHGGGGPGMGPIGVKTHLKAFLPRAADNSAGPIGSARYGSASILTIPWMYIAMSGAQGLQQSSAIAILNANYMLARLEDTFPILFRNKEGRVAHEFILSFKAIKESTGITVEDVAKRLMDYGFHAPTMSWPVLDSLMIEPTESESKAELDRYCDALISIRSEIGKVESGEWPRDNNPLKNAPHTAHDLAAETWDHPYSRNVACFPGGWATEHKFWPPVNRVDNAHGDRNLVCTCPPLDAYQH